MATHDYLLDNQNGALFRSDVNGALQAIVTSNSSPTAPTTTFPFMLWADTTTGILKQRNAGNTAWVNLYNYASPGIIDAVNFHTGTLLTPWTNYTPTVSAASGTLTSFTVSGKYKQIGKTIHGQVLINVTNNGTGSGALRFTLPPLAPTGSFIGVGRETTVTGAMLQVVLPTSGSASIFKYDNTYPVASGQLANVSFTYESV